MLLIATLVVPFLGLAAILIVKSYRDERAAMAKMLTGTARAISALVDTALDDSVSQLDTLATADALTSDNLPAFEAQVRELFPDKSRWFVLLDLTGQQLINSRLPPGTRLPLAVIESDLVARLRRGEVYISDLRQSRATTEYVVHIARPYFRNGSLAYILSVTLSPAALARRLDIAAIAPGEVCSVADRQGVIICRNPNSSRFVGASLTPDLVATIAKQREGSLDTVTLEKIPVVTAFTHSKCGWVTAIGAPRQVVYASARELLWWTTAGGLLLLTLAGTFTVWMSRDLVRGTDWLADNARRIGTGELPDAASTGYDELDFVAATLRNTARALSTELRARSAAEAELRAAQTRLHEHAQELEREVDARTRSLREAILQMEEFSYTVSHDLRAPLRSMQAFSDVLLEDFGVDLDPTARDYVLRIHRAAQRMDQMTANLLQYGRVARAEVQLQPVAVQPLLENIVDTYPQLQGGRVEIVKPLPLVRAHEPSLSQCLANLLVNAAKFVKPGEAPHIVVRAEERDAGTVRIVVEDHGIGVPPEQHARIFGIFERAHGSQYEGTGVGLAIVRKAVEKMNGTCGVESDGQHGSRFWIELPRA